MTLCCLISIAAREGWELHQFDVNGAYLKGELDEELYMEVPEGVNIKGRESSVWRLLKPIYGLKQAGHQYQKKRDETMTSLGFEKSAANPSLYVK